MSFLSCHFVSLPLSLHSQWQNFRILSIPCHTVPCFKAGIPTWQDPQVLVSVLPILLTLPKKDWKDLSISQRTMLSTNWSQNLSMKSPGCRLHFRNLRNIYKNTPPKHSHDHHQCIFETWSYDLIISYRYLISYQYLTVWVLRGHFPVLAPILCTNIRCKGQNSLCRFKFKIVRILSLKCSKMFKVKGLMHNTSTRCSWPLVESEHN